jgi:chaperone required for assembly of F1-ATPase
MRRFYKDVTAVETPQGFSFLLDGKPVKTPARQDLLLPSLALAEALAEEWRGQGPKIKPATMPLTRLVNSVVDGVRSQRAATIRAILRFGENDLLSYRAEAPPTLVERQRQWDAYLAWAAERHGAALKVTSGIAPVEQPAEALEALRNAVSAQGDFTLAALHVLASITGSLVLGLAVLEDKLSAADAFNLSRLDETYQAELWGQDREAEARARRLAAEMDDAARLLALSRT